jgi:hypothetical protein
MGNDQRAIIQAICPGCRTELSLRLPQSCDEGEFSFQCYKCGTVANIDIQDLDCRKFTMRRAGKGPVRSENPIPRPSKRKARLKVAAVLLVLAGILGLLSSVLAVSQSFSIVDSEDLVRSDYTTLSVSVIDAVSGRPIEQVEVTVTAGSVNYTSYTNTAGITNLRVPPGSSVINLHKDGYKSVDSDITTKKSTPNVLDVPMEKGDPSETIPIRTPQFVSKKDSTLITDVMAMIMFLTSVISFVAAYYTYKGEFFLLAIVGSFLAIFSFGFFIGSILAIVATSIITFSYHHFSHTHVLQKLLDLRREEIVSRLRRGS